MPPIVFSIDGMVALQIPENFQQTVKCYDPSQRINYRAGVCVVLLSCDVMCACLQLSQQLLIHKHKNSATSLASPTHLYPQVSCYSQLQMMIYMFQLESTASAAGVTTLTWLGGDTSCDQHSESKQRCDQDVNILSTGQINSNPDRINIDSDDDDVTMTTDTPTAQTSNDNDFLPLDTTETHPLATETSENRKRLNTDGGGTIVIKRRNASLYQSQDNDDNINSDSVDAYQDY